MANLLVRIIGNLNLSHLGLGNLKKNNRSVSYRTCESHVTVLFNVRIKTLFSYLNLGVGISSIGVSGIRKSAVGEGKAGDHRGNSGGGRGGSRGFLIGGPPPPGLACR